MSQARPGLLLQDAHGLIAVGQHQRQQVELGTIREINLEDRKVGVLRLPLQAYRLLKSYPANRLIFGPKPSLKLKVAG